MIQELGGVPEEDMRRTFNLGIGMILIVEPDAAEGLMRDLQSESPVRVGTVAKR